MGIAYAEVSDSIFRKIGYAGRNPCQLCTMLGLRWMLGAALLVLWALPVQAQLTEGDTLRWKGQASLNSSLTQGNVERFLAIGEVAGSHHRHPVGLQGSIRYLYGTFGPFRTENDWTARCFAYWRPDRRLYPFIMALSESQLRRQIDYRVQVGVGLSVWFVRQRQGQLKFSLSTTAERTDYTADRLEGLGPLTHRRLEVMRLTARLAGQIVLLADRLSLSYEAWGQQSFSQPENQRLFLQAGFQSKLHRSIALQSRLLYLWESWVPPRVAAADLFWTAGFTIQLQSPAGTD